MAKEELGKPGEASLLLPLFFPQRRGTRLGRLLYATETAFLEREREREREREAGRQAGRETDRQRESERERQRETWSRMTKVSWKSK